MNLTLPALFFLFLSALPAFASPEADRQIEETAAASYNFRTALEKQVQVKAEGGVVTLTGTVLDQDQKTLAVETVRGLDGVTEVKNQLNVAPVGEERSDRWIALKIRSLLLLRSHVSAAKTDVTVRDGNVVLSGTAENPLQKELTGKYAREVEGVKSVKNNLVIAAVSDGGPVASPERRLEPVDDTSITAQVKSTLQTNPATRTVKAAVQTLNGVVTIRGKAKTEAEKALVTALAQSVKGVAALENSLTVNAGAAE